MSNTTNIIIPIIPYGLRHEETIVQIAIALDNISSLVNNVFQQIEDNIKKHNEYLCGLKKRSEVISSKVEKIAGMNDVTTTVYSCHKFPPQVSSFDSLYNFNLKSLEKKWDISVEETFQQAKQGCSWNKLHFFHVRPEPVVDEKELILEKGLGGLPADANYISSLLLFNTGENLYYKYVQLDPLAIGDDTKSAPEETKKEDIAAAPTSIITEQVFQNKDYFKSFYTPAYEEVPFLDIPTNLPDLPGIARNLTCNISTESPTASSKQIKIDEETKTTVPVTDLRATSESNAVSLNDATIAYTTQNPVIIPPPPPLPSVEILPPPPPTFPDFAQPKLLQKEDFGRSSSNMMKTAGATENVHANLMEAIRKAGGKEKAKLKPVYQSENKETTKEQFMGELYHTLAMRRKGISGQKEAGKNESMMNRLSSLISASSDSGENDTDENEITEDWND